jgi:hypothetical protein
VLALIGYLLMVCWAEVGTLALDQAARHAVYLTRYPVLHGAMAAVSHLDAGDGLVVLIAVGSVTLWRRDRCWALVLPPLMAGTRSPALLHQVVRRPCATGSHALGVSERPRAQRRRVLRVPRVRGVGLGREPTPKEFDRHTVCDSGSPGSVQPALPGQTLAHRPGRRVCHRTRISVLGRPRRGDGSCPADGRGGC